MIEAVLSGAKAAADYVAEIPKRIQAAERKGIRTASSIVKRTYAALVSFRGGKAPAGQLGTDTGDYKRGIRVKTFQYRDKSWGGSIKVRNQRGFVERLHATGYSIRRTRGGPAIARVEARAPGAAALARHEAEIGNIIEQAVQEALN